MTADEAGKFLYFYGRSCSICGVSDHELIHRLDNLYYCQKCDESYSQRGISQYTTSHGVCRCGCTYERHYYDPNQATYCQYCSCRVWARPNKVENDPVNHPAHYTQHPSGVECIQITEHYSFCVGNAIKYLWRADLKDGLQDLKKALWYIQREIERRERNDVLKTSE